MKHTFLLIAAYLTAGVLQAGVIDLRQMPYTDETFVVAIDIKVNPTNMPSQMLWDDPILMIYRQVPSFDNLDVDALRAEATEEFRTGQYQPVVLRTRQNQDLTLHLMNLIGLGDAPQRVVQGVVCKNCKKAYTFGYGEGLERSQFPFRASLHGHGISYTIDNDGTNAGNNVSADPANYGLASPGESRTYYYQKLDTPGVWPIHDHAHPSHTVSRGLHMALVVEDADEKRAPDYDFVIIFSDYPDYEAYKDEFYAQTFIPAFLHMRNGNVMHAHALNGYAAMMAPRINMAVAGGNSRFDMMRTDILPEPRTPVFDVPLGSLVRFRLLSMGSAMATHSFHIHGHVWWDEGDRKYRDSIAVPGGESYELMFWAGGGAYKPNLFVRNLGGSPVGEQFKLRSGAGDWLYHCHVVPHVKHGMWGLFRVHDPAAGDGQNNPGGPGSDGGTGTGTESDGENNPTGPGSDGAGKTHDGP